jgi:hypothetical protein
VIIRAPSRIPAGSAFSNAALIALTRQATVHVMTLELNPIQPEH